MQLLAIILRFRRRLHSVAQSDPLLFIISFNAVRKQSLGQSVNFILQPLESSFTIGIPYSTVPKKNGRCWNGPGGNAIYYYVFIQS